MSYNVWHLIYEDCKTPSDLKRVEDSINMIEKDLERIFQNIRCMSNQYLKMNCEPVKFVLGILGKNTLESQMWINALQKPKER
jgi:hypothetical protein